MTGTWRIAGVGIVLALMLGALGLRLWTIQVTESDIAADVAARNLIRVVPTPPPGEISSTATVNSSRGLRRRWPSSSTSV